MVGRGRPAAEGGDRGSRAVDGSRASMRPRPAVLAGQGTRPNVAGASRRPVADLRAFEAAADGRGADADAWRDVSAALRREVPALRRGRR